MFCSLTNIATQGLYLNEFEIINLAEVIYVTSISFSMFQEAETFQEEEVCIKVVIRWGLYVRSLLGEDIAVQFLSYLSVQVSL